MSSTIEDDRSAMRKRWDGFKQTLYDPEKKTVLGRGGKSWAKILIFYLFYYGFLAVLFAVAISIVSSTLDDYTPKYQTRLQTPGVAIQPKIPSSVEQTSNIKYATNTEDKYYKELVGQMTKFLYSYSPENQTSGTFRNCSENQPPNVNQEYDGEQLAASCTFDKARLGPCATPPYGYLEGKPCILIKLNRIINWYPVGFTDLSVPQATGLTESDAPDLVDVLTTYGLQYKPYLLYTVCYGQEGKDKQLLNGGDMTKNKYYPSDMGMPFAYYPYKGAKRQPNYVNPVVAVQFTNVTAGEKINVACKVYARNIQDSKEMAEGFFQFELQID